MLRVTTTIKKEVKVEIPMTMAKMVEMVMTKTAFRVQMTTMAKRVNLTMTMVKKVKASLMRRK
jgi:hypothetical protein